MCLPLQTSRMLDEEQREDTELRDRFKEQWKREPSGKLTETLRKEVGICLGHAMTDLLMSVGVCV